MIDAVDASEKEKWMRGEAPRLFAKSEAIALLCEGRDTGQSRALRNVSHSSTGWPCRLIYLIPIQSIQASA